MNRPLLVLRPQPGADRTVGRARDLGFDAQSYPLFAIRARPWSGPDPARMDALLVTSANAVRHGGADILLYRHLPAYAVGPATAEALRAAGFIQVIAGHEGVREAIGLMGRAGHGHALHLSGADIHPYGAHSLRITRAIVYEAIETGDAAGLAQRLRSGMILLVHSPRAAARLAGLLPLNERESLRLIAISPAASEAAGPGWRQALAAAAPTDKAMLALAATLCDCNQACRRMDGTT